MPERRLRGTHMGSSTMQPEVTRIFPSPRTRTCHLAQPGGPGAKIQSWATNSETAWCPTRSEGIGGGLPGFWFREGAGEREDGIRAGGADGAKRSRYFPALKCSCSVVLPFPPLDGGKPTPFVG